MQLPELRDGMLAAAKPRQPQRREKKPRAVALPVERRQSARVRGEQPDAALAAGIAKESRGGQVTLAAGLVPSWLQAVVCAARVSPHACLPGRRLLLLLSHTSGTAPVGLGAVLTHAAVSTAVQHLHADPRPRTVGLTGRRGQHLGPCWWRLHLGGWSGRQGECHQVRTSSQQAQSAAGACTIQQQRR